MIIRLCSRLHTSTIQVKQKTSASAHQKSPRRSPHRHPAPFSACSQQSFTAPPYAHTTQSPPGTDAPTRKHAKSANITKINVTHCCPARKQEHVQLHLPTPLARRRAFDKHKTHVVHGPGKAQAQVGRGKADNGQLADAAVLELRLSQEVEGDEVREPNRVKPHVAYIGYETSYSVSSKTGAHVHVGRYVR